MQRDESAAARDVVQQGLLLFLADLGRVRVDSQRVVLAERLGVQVGGLVGVGQLDPATRQHGGELLESLEWPMRAAVPQEQHGQRFSLRRGRIGSVDIGAEKPEREQRKGGQAGSEPHRSNSLAMRAGRRSLGRTPVTAGEICANRMLPRSRLDGLSGDFGQVPPLGAVASETRTAHTTTSETRPLDTLLGNRPRMLQRPSEVSVGLGPAGRRDRIRRAYRLNAVPELAQGTPLGFGERREGRLIADGRQRRIHLPPAEPAGDARSLRGRTRIHDRRRGREIGTQPFDRLATPLRPRLRPPIPRAPERPRSRRGPLRGRPGSDSWRPDPPRDREMRRTLRSRGGPQPRAGLGRRPVGRTTRPPRRSPVPRTLHHGGKTRLEGDRALSARDANISGVMRGSGGGPGSIRARARVPLRLARLDERPAEEEM